MTLEEYLKVYTGGLSHLIISYGPNKSCKAIGISPELKKRKIKSIISFNYIILEPTQEDIINEFLSFLNDFEFKKMSHDTSAKWLFFGYKVFNLDNRLFSQEQYNELYELFLKAFEDYINTVDHKDLTVINDFFKALYTKLDEKIH